MNLNNLKYALEVETCGSISQASKNLYLAQPNLSKAIKELETEFHINLFTRNSRGVEPTPEGRVFLEKARRIIEEVEELKDMTDRRRENRISMRVSVPRGSYITYAFTQYLKDIPQDKAVSVYYDECSTEKAIDNLFTHRFGLAILRYDKKNAEYVESMIRVRGLKVKPLLDFNYIILTAKDGELAKEKEITEEVLRNYTEIIHGDTRLTREEYQEMTLQNEKYSQGQQIYIYERGSQFDLLRMVPRTYMWVSSVPDAILEANEMTQIHCPFETKCMHDVLVWRDNHRLTREEQAFIGQIEKVIKDLS